MMVAAIIATDRQKPEKHDSDTYNIAKNHK